MTAQNAARAAAAGAGTAAQGKIPAPPKNPPTQPRRAAQTGCGARVASLWSRAGRRGCVLPFPSPVSTTH